MCLIFSIFSNPDPRVEILKQIVYDNSGILSPESRPQILFLEILIMEIGRTCSVIFRFTCKGSLGRRVRVSWTLNPVQRLI